MDLLIKYFEINEYHCHLLVKSTKMKFQQMNSSLNNFKYQDEEIKLLLTINQIKLLRKQHNRFQFYIYYEHQIYPNTQHTYKDTYKLNKMQFIPHQHNKFKIVSPLDESMVIDCVMEGDNPLVLHKWHAGPNQRWNMREIGNNKWLFVNVHNSKVLSAPGKNQSSEIKCKISRKAQEQIWELVPFKELQDKFAFYFKSSSGKVIDLCEGKANNSQPLIEYEVKNSKKVVDKLNQLWIIQPVSLIPECNAQYKIFPAMNYSLAFDASKDPNDFKNIILYHCHKGENQNFRISTHNGKYMIICEETKQSRLSLQVESRSHQNQARIRLAQNRKQNHELWEFIPCKMNEYKNKGAYFIRSYCGKYVDISNVEAVQGAKVIQWDYNGNKNQIWYIRKI